MNYNATSIQLDCSVDLKSDEISAQLMPSEFLLLQPFATEQLIWNFEISWSKFRTLLVQRGLKSAVCNIHERQAQ